MKPEELIKKKIEEVKSFLKFDMETDDKSVAEMLTLGGNWDRPEVVMEALDCHAMYEAKWGSLLRRFNLDKAGAESKLKHFEADSKEIIHEIIFADNVGSGMTANNANPTGTKINNFYLVNIINGDGKNSDAFTFEEKPKKDCETFGDRVRLYNQLKFEYDGACEYAEEVELVVRAFKNRSIMLVQMGGLLKSMMDNQIIILKRPKTKTSHHLIS